MKDKTVREAAHRAGILYLVATPIGNLDDLSRRAVQVLQHADVIAAEDTRHSRPLLDRYGIAAVVTALHEHNEDRASERLLDRLEAGATVAVISDAGTPLINDPGLPLVRLARERGFRIIPVPGPCALIAALSASGLAVDRFAFEGFPPRTRAARRRIFKALREEPRTLIFYEASHRVRDCVRDLAAVFPPERRLVIARELTKVHETIVEMPLSEAQQRFEEDQTLVKGEFVLLLEGAPPKPAAQELTAEQERILEILLTECTVKTAATLAAKITGAPRDLLYRRALDRAERQGPPPATPQ